MGFVSFIILANISDKIGNATKNFGSVNLRNFYEGFFSLLNLNPSFAAPVEKTSVTSCGQFNVSVLFGFHWFGWDCGMGGKFFSPCVIH